jgi:hypothetical protein
MNRGRRAVLDDARRKVERALAVGDAAEEVAKAAEAVLAANPADAPELAALRAALARYRAIIRA